MQHLRCPKCQHDLFDVLTMDGNFCCPNCKRLMNFAGHVRMPWSEAMMDAKLADKWMQVITFVALPTGPIIGCQLYTPHGTYDTIYRSNNKVAAPDTLWGGTYTPGEVNCMGMADRLREQLAS